MLFVRLFDFFLTVLSVHHTIVAGYYRFMFLFSIGASSNLQITGWGFGGWVRVGRRKIFDNFDLSAVWTVGILPALEYPIDTENVVLMIATSFLSYFHQT